MQINILKYLKINKYKWHLLLLFFVKFIIHFWQETHINSSVI